MSQPFDVVGYVVDTETYCPKDAQFLAAAEPTLVSITDQLREVALDSPIFADSEWDYPVHCTYCDVLLDTNLTPDGLEYVKYMINEALEAGEQNDVLRSWFLAFVDTNDEWVWIGNIDDALEAYLAAALWSESPYASIDDEGNVYPDENATQSYTALNYTVDDDVSPDAVEAMRQDVSYFLAANAGDLLGLSLKAIGHNFWLTRNRHGAGFWDIGLGDRGDRLTEAAHAYGSSNLYLSYTGTIEVD
jgi:hypothetical protein